MKKVLKLVGIGLGVLVLLSLLGFSVASMKASARLAQRFDSHKVALPPPDSLEQSLARGKHLVEARYACTICHGSDFAGGVMIDDPAIGTLLGPNITNGGKGSRTKGYKDADWDRIVRHGIKRDGTPAVMPSEDFFKMSDRELADIVAYIQSLPPIDREVAAPSFGPIGKVLIVLGKFPISAEKLESHTAAHTEMPPVEGDTKEFGAHLAAICSGCHRANYAGGPMPFGPPDWPPAGNLTQHATGLKGWSFEDFERALTQGIRKDGRKLLPPMSDALPAAQAMTPTERRALWTFLTSLPPHATNP